MHKSLAILLVAGFALLGCAKPERQAVDGNHVPGEDTMGHITALGPGTQLKTTTLDGVKVLWTPGDKIGMYVSAEDLKQKSEYSAILEEPSAQATFGRTSDLTPGKAEGKYLAVYPSSAVAQWGTDAIFCYVNVPAQQTAVKGSWDKSAAILAATSQTSEFAFHHAVSYLRFEVTSGTGGFVSVRLSSAGGEKLSDSQAGVQLTDADKLVLSPGSSALDYVILRNSVGEIPFEEGAYYISFLPGVFSGGLKLVFANAAGLVAEKTVSPLTLSPGDVVNYGAVEALEFKEVPVPLEKANVYKENGVSQGVVYWINPDDPSKGKIVSAASEEMLWSDGLIWTTKIESTVDGLANLAQFNASDVYTSQKDKFYALKYCEDLRESLGGNWYLPAPGELQTLYKAYYGLSVTTLQTGTDYRFDGGVLLQSAMDTKSGFDAALRTLEGNATASLDGDADADGTSDANGFGNASGVLYWTSKVNTGGPAQYVNFGVYSVANNKDKYTSAKAYVRCIRDVTGGSVEPSPRDETKTYVSLLGDSITTFQDYLPAYFNANGAAYYPTGTVTSVTQQYWYKLIYGKMHDALLDVNNSWRGATVIWRDHPDYDGKDYCARVDRYGLGDPDVILIHGGTNDCTKHSDTYAPRPGLHRADMYPGITGMDELPTDAQIQEIYGLAAAADSWEKIMALEDHYFIHAYVKLLNMIHFKYPKAKVVIIIGDYLTECARDALVKIAGHYGSLYGYRYVDFFGEGDKITKVSSAHPDDAGFTYMAEKIYEEVGASYIDKD